MENINLQVQGGQNPSSENGAGYNGSSLAKELFVVDGYEDREKKFCLRVWPVMT